ncbi:MAG: YceI family protein [Acidobacteriaceae bacterium]|nr:YceI family protein [Acidobacteriaceae bacterium]
MPRGQFPKGRFRRPIGYFSAWHHVVGTVRGRFDKVTATVTASPDPAACAVDVTIATYSISTQNAARDDDLRGPISLMSLDFPL